MVFRFLEVVEVVPCCCCCVGGDGLKSSWIEHEVPIPRLPKSLFCKMKERHGAVRRFDRVMNQSMGRSVFKAKG